jgi:hypothetical protein
MSQPRHHGTRIVADSDGFVAEALCPCGVTRLFAGPMGDRPRRRARVDGRTVEDKNAPDSDHCPNLDGLPDASSEREDGDDLARRVSASRRARSNWRVGPWIR